jgi:GH25 family lysozyme M1 (1,4-beta-N-acetylmuramidase)
MFPCRGKEADAQVQEMVKALSERRGHLRQELEALYGTVWIDVETNTSPSCSWKSFTPQENCKYLSDLVRSLKNHAQKPGIYASAHMWEEILGSRTNCPDFKDLPLWYAHYDHDPSFADWPGLTFGGWTKPTIKQYQGTTVLCNTGVDFNYRP